MKHERQLEPTPEPLAEWAKCELAMHLLANEPNRRDAELGSIPPLEHPAILIQAALQEIFRPSSPLEIYSDEQPTFTPPSPQEDPWIPIDILLGCYQPKVRTIRIFHRNVQHFAGTAFRCGVSDLELIVRLHEFAHALIHLGVFSKDDVKVIRDYPPTTETDWGPFLRTRSRAFRSLHGHAHEFLAQVLCWATIGMLQPLSDRHRLQELFVAVMDRQPPEYHLSPDVLSKALYADPTAMLSWARETPRAKPPRRTSDRQVAQALLRATFP